MKFLISLILFKKIKYIKMFDQFKANYRSENAYDRNAFHSMRTSIEPILNRD